MKMTIRMNTDPETHATLEDKARANGKTLEEYLDDQVQPLKELLALMGEYGERRRCWRRFI